MSQITDVKRLPLDVCSSPKGFINCNATKFDVLPVASQFKNDYFDKSHASFEEPFKIDMAGSSHLRFDSQKPFYYSSHQFINNFEYRNVQNSSKLNDNSNYFLNPQRDYNFSPITTNILNLLNSSSLKNTLNLPKSSYLVNNNSSNNSNVKETTFDLNKEFNSFSTIFKDTQSILNGEDTCPTKIENSDESVDKVHENSYVKTEPSSPILEETNNLFLEAYQHIRSGLSDGEHSTNSSDNFDIDCIKDEPIDSTSLLERKNARTEKNKMRMRMKRELQKQTESPEERAQRLLQMRDAARLRRMQESTEKRLERLQKDREKKRLYRAKLKEHDNYHEILAKNRILMRIRRQNEEFREKERERDRIRHRIKRTNIEYREKERIKERERKRLSRFLKKYSEQYSGFQHFAQQLFSVCPERTENSSTSSQSLLQN